MSANKAQEKTVIVTNTLRFAIASDVFGLMPEMAEDMDSKPDQEGCIDFLNKLSAGDTPEEALTFAAYMFSPRNSVWWAHECLNSLPAHLHDQDEELLNLCKVWVGDPSETARNAVLQMGLSKEKKTPAVWVALAAGWSEGSMAPESDAPVEAPKFLTGRAVNAGVLSMLARVSPEQRTATIEKFVEMAQQLATA